MKKSFLITLSTLIISVVAGAFLVSCDKETVKNIKNIKIVYLFLNYNFLFFQQFLGLLYLQE